MMIWVRDPAFARRNVKLARLLVQRAQTDMMKLLAGFPTRETPAWDTSRDG